MKKLMIMGVAALAAAVSFADVESENVVGYMNKANPETGNTYITAPFRPVGSSVAVDLQDLQMDATVTTGSANIQLLDKDGCSQESKIYKWLAKSDAATYSIIVPEGKNGLWTIQSSYYDEEEEMDIISYTLPSTAVTFNPGEGMQLFSGANKTVNFAGEVSDAQVVLSNPNTGNMYVGNAFVAGLDLQSIQMDATVTTGSANIQLLDKDGCSQESKIYKWLAKSDAATYSIIVPEGKNGLWTIQSSYYDEEEEMDIISYSLPSSDVIFEAGQGFQLFSGSDKQVTFLPPYSL